MTEIDIEQILPIKKIENKEYINSSNYRSISFGIRYPEVFLQEKEWLVDFQLKLRNYTKMLPDYAIVQSLSFFDEEEYSPNYENVNTILERGKEFHYAQRAVPYQEDYVIITFSDKSLLKGLTNHTVNKNHLLQNNYKDAVKNIEQVDLAIENAIASIEVAFDGCSIRQLENEEKALLVYKYLSLDYKKKDVKNLKLPSINTENHKIADNNIGFLSIYEGRMVESYRKASMTDPKNARSEIKQVKDPGEINQSQMFPITIGLPFPHVYSCVIQKLPVSKVLKDIDIEERSINLPATLGMPSAITKRKDLSAFKNLITEHGFTPAHVAMSLIIPEKNKTLLNSKIELAKNAISNINEMSAEREDYELPYLFFSNCPGNANEQYKFNLTTLINATSFFPKESHYFSDKEGFYLTDRFGKPFLLNLLYYPSMTNKNGLIIGPSGRGKSYTINYLVNLLYHGAHIMLIDKGGSYEKIIKLFKGEYFDSDDIDKFSFSLFECEKDKDGNFDPDELHKNFIRSVLIFIWKRGNKPKNEEDVCLMEFIDMYYEHINEKKEQNHSLTDFVNFIKNNWLNFDEKIRKFFDLDSFDLMTTQYTTGNQKRLFNSQQNIDLTYKSIVGFDLKSLEKSNPDKFNLICILITFLSIKKVQRLPRRIFKSYIIDEALSFLKGDIGEFIGNLFAEFRKENGQVLIAAQGFKYIKEASEEVQQKIYANRDFIVMTNHSGYENSFKDYVDNLGFTEKHIELLKSVRNKEEVFFRLGSKGVIARIETCPEEDATFTMDEKELPQIEKIYKKLGSMEATILEFARQKQLKKQGL